MIIACENKQQAYPKKLFINLNTNMKKETLVRRLQVCFGTKIKHEWPN